MFNVTFDNISVVSFPPGFVNYKKGCTRLAAASDKVYQLLAHGWWFSPASSTIKTGRHGIAEILLKVALSTINQSISCIVAVSFIGRGNRCTRRKPSTCRMFYRVNLTMNGIRTHNFSADRH